MPTTVIANVDTVGASLPDPVATNRAVGDRHTITDTGIDYVVESISGTLTFVAVTPPPPTTASLGAAKSTVGAGLPPVSQRVAGDLHYDTNAKKGYVVTGLIGAVTTDNFNGADGSNPTTSSGASYGGGGAYIPSRSGNQGIAGSPFSFLPYSSGPISFSLDWAPPSAGYGIMLHLGIDNTALSANHLVIGFRNDGIIFTYVDGGVSTQNLQTGPSNYTPINGTTRRLDVEYNPTSGLLQVYVDGSLRGTSVITGYDTAPKRNAAWGVYTFGGASLGPIDNLYLASLGTLAWTLDPSTVDVVNTVAASGATQTIPDPDVAATSQITVTANCTITLPTPAAGKSCTVAVSQDGVGGRTVAWATPSGTVRWPGGTAPTQTTAVGKTDVYSFLCTDGVNWMGFVAGQNY